MASASTVQERTPDQQAQFEALVREINESRPLPAIAPRLIAMSEDARFSGQDLADTIRTDQALTLKILRLASSPLFGMPRRVTSLREAIVLLGFREVRSMALGACVVDFPMRERLSEAKLDYDQFWLNSLVIAQFAQSLAVLERVDREEAFTGGVGHNVGRLALAQHRPLWLASAIEGAARNGTTVQEAQRAQLGSTDAEIGSGLALTWSFPSALVEAVERQQWHLSDLPDRHGLDSVVARARRFARAHGMSDGVDAIPARVSPEMDWQMPQVANALRQVGGVDGVMERARAFVFDAA